MNSYNTAASAAPEKPSAVPKILSVITLIISAISLISAIALMILIHIKVAGGDTAGFQMAAFIAGIGIFMIGSLLLALIGGIAGIIMTIVTFVTRRTGIVWMPIVSVAACIASAVITVCVL